MHDLARCKSSCLLGRKRAEILKLNINEVNRESFIESLRGNHLSLGGGGNGGFYKYMLNNLFFKTF